MNIELVNKIKRLTIIALASEDDLIETIVLKGGNAIDLLFENPLGALPRTSYDLDFSVENEFFQDEEEIRMRIEKALNITFLEHGYVMIDYKFFHKPHKRNKVTETFWGGYAVMFKVLEQKQFEELRGNIEKQRQIAIASRPDRSPSFQLEFSKFEYIGKKKEIKVDGYSIYHRFSCIIPTLNRRPLHFA